MIMSKSVSQVRNWKRSYGVLLLLVPVVAYFAGTAISAALSSPVITTIAGGGSPASGNGDSGPATGARLSNPVDVAVDASGNVYIADVAVFVGQDGFKVRKVDTAGNITTVAGNGDNSYNGDGIAATSAGISIKGIAVDGSGNLYIADAHNQRVRRVAPNGLISTVAGNGTSDFSGDGGQARNARLNFPSDVATDTAGNLYILDAFNLRVRRVGIDGVIRTIAGNGQYGFSGDGGPAIQASFANPTGIAVDASGNVLVADQGNNRVRRITPAGIISTFAGGGRFRSDPVAANSVLFNPTGVATDARGNVYISELNNLVRVVSAGGIMQVAAGQFNDTTFGNAGAQWGFAGDGGPADQALLYEPLNLALDAQQNLYIADSRNGRIRKVSQVPTPPTPAGVDAFRPYQANVVGSFTQHVAVADVTGDGRDDALLTTTSWGYIAAEPDNDMRLWVFVQRPDGTLAAPLKYPYLGDGAGGRSGTGLATADLDRDGFMDVIVGTLNGVAIFRGNAAGVSNAVVSEGVENAQSVTSVAVMDVDRDGRRDIVTLGCCRAEGGTSPFDGYGMTVHYGNGAGGISRKILYPTGQQVGGNLKAIDMNRDGIPDLIKSWGEYQSGGVDVMLHNGVDGFRPPIRLGAVAQTGMSGAYAVGDFNHDGLRDVILSRGGNAPQASYVHFRQDAQGQFTQIRDWRAFDSPDELLGADMDGDARDDLLVVHGGWSSIGYHQQTDMGLDIEVKNLTVQSGNPRLPALAVGDLNGDGCKDVAMADYNYGLIVMHGKKCVIAREGSRALLPRKPVVPVSGTFTASTAQPVLSSQHGNPQMPAMTRLYRSVANGLPQIFNGGYPRSSLMVGSAGLFGLFFGLWWLVQMRFRK